jgi:ankyrin repeat protein
VAGHSDRSTKALLDHGADVNARNSGGLTALMIAAASNQAEMVSLLINSGADKNAKDENGNTALGIAQSKGNDAVIKLLGTSSS